MQQTSSNLYPPSNYSSRIVNLLSDETKNNFDFYSVSSHPRRWDTIDAVFSIDSRKPKVIFDHEDEWHNIPPYYNRDDVKLILKDYAPFNYFQFSKIMPLPVVFNHKYPFDLQKPIKDRKHLLFSSLWSSPARKGVRDALSFLENREDCRIMWNDGFAGGLPFEEYQKEMRDSVVAICCSGYMSPEVARMHEALVAGNIIITSRRPPYPFYEDHPFIEYDDPAQIPNLVLSINKMSNEEKQKLVEKGNQYYIRKYSAEAIAKQIENFLRRIT